jgi:SAM-dependent methyltransferase
MGESNQSESQEGDDRRGSPERFGYSWDRFNALTPQQERQFQLWTPQFSPAQDWKGKRILDAGCGAGRNSYWPLTYGAASCMSVDLDERSLEAARKNLAGFPKAEVRRCSIYELDYENEFDIAFSIGVIHHLDNPAAAMLKLAKAVKPGGRVLIWVYGYENLEFFVNILDPARKLLFSWMPLWMVRWLAYLPSAALWLLLRLGITPLAYLRLLKDFPFDHLHHIVFDQMLPRIANYWTREEATALLVQAGLADVKATWVNEVSWSVIGTKPAG